MGRSGHRLASPGYFVYSRIMESSEAAAAFAALSQPTRLDLLRLLIGAGGTGFPAGEIAARLAIPPSTLSFHLAALERAGLTLATRQGRQIVHAARFEGLRRLLRYLTETCGADLAAIFPALPEKDPGMTPAFNVLFLCTHNAARSIMAEAILRAVGGQRFRAWSAGSDPGTAPNAEVLARLGTLGHDTAALRSKSWHEFTGPNAPAMDFVITLCDIVDDQKCPDFGDLPVTAAWPLPDPAKFTGSSVERAAMLNMLYASLRRRIEIFVALPFASLDRMAIKARLDEIAAGELPVLAGSR